METATIFINAFHLTNTNNIALIINNESCAEGLA